MAQKLNFRAFLAKATAKIRKWLTQAAAQAAAIWKKIWSLKIDHRNPAIAGFITGVAAGYISIPLHSIILPTPHLSNIAYLLLILASIMAFVPSVFLISRLLWGFHGRDSRAFTLVNILVFCQFIGARRESSPQWLTIGELLLIALMTILVLRWLWNTLPARHRKVTKNAVCGYIKTLPGYIRQDWVLRKQTRQYLNYIGLFSIAFFLFFDPTDPIYGDFTPRVQLIALATGLGFMVFWFFMWIHELWQRLNETRKQSHQVDRPEGAIVINLGYPLVVTSGIAGFMLATIGPSIPIFSWKLVLWLHNAYFEKATALAGNLVDAIALAIH